MIPTPEEKEKIEQEIEISIQAATEIVERKNSMERLISNPDFAKIFTVGYLEKEASRLVSCLADNEWQTPEKQAELAADMRAISSFRQFILGIKQMGKQMENQISRSQDELDQLREGE